jgi:hypothetical protein
MIGLGLWIRSDKKANAWKKARMRGLIKGVS